MNIVQRKHISKNKAKASIAGIGILGILIVLGVPGMVAAQYDTYDQVDYVTAQDFSRFQSLWDKAETETVRLALFGDSQEGSPGDGGASYIPLLNKSFFDQFGKVGETFVAPGTGSYGGGSPPAEWLLRGAALGATASGLTASEQLPGQNTARYSSTTPYGALTKLEVDNPHVKSPSLHGVQIWDSSKPLHATLFARQRAGGSPGLKWEARPSNDSPSYSVPTSASGTAAMGLDNAAGAIVSQDIGPLPFNGKTYQQIIVKGSTAAGADYLGVRFHNPDGPGGVVVQDFASGGYHTSTFLSDHADSGPMLKAFGSWDAIVIHTGANDAFGGLGKSAGVYRTDVQALINAIRSPDWLDNPEQKFILVTDPARKLTTAADFAKGAQFDQYAGALAAIAQADPNVMAINSRRRTEDVGWKQGSTDPYLIDAVHYSELGSQVMADADFLLMFSGPGADFDSDGDVDGADFLNWQRGESPNPLSSADLALWQENYGDTSSFSSAATAIPEPTSVMLLLVCLLTSAVSSLKIVPHRL